MKNNPRMSFHEEIGILVSKTNDNLIEYELLEEEISKIDDKLKSLDSGVSVTFLDSILKEVNNQDLLKEFRGNVVECLPFKAFNNVKEFKHKKHIEFENKHLLIKENFLKLPIQKARDILISEVLQMLLVSAQIAFVTKASSLKERIDIFIDEVKFGFENLIKNIGDVFKKIFGVSLKEILTKIIDFFSNLLFGAIKNMVKISRKLIRDIVKIFHILSDPSSSWEDKKEELINLLALAVSVIVGILGADLLTNVIPILNDFKDTIEIVMGAIFAGIIIFWIEKFRKNKIEIASKLRIEKIDNEIEQSKVLGKAFSNCLAIEGACYNEIFDRMVNTDKDDDSDNFSKYMNLYIYKMGGEVHYKKQEDFNEAFDNDYLIKI